MITKIVELTNGFNWGKFMVARFDEKEWEHRSKIDGGTKMLGGRGWTPTSLLVLDLQTGEGAIFRPGGLAKVDLEKHAVWVCPMYHVFLNWLYNHPEYWREPKSILSLPDDLTLTDEETDKQSAIYGHRRSGPSQEVRAAKVRETELPRKSSKPVPAKLTGPQLEELRKLAQKPQNTYGKARARVQGNLVGMGLAEFADDKGNYASPLDGERCQITDRGRQMLTNGDGR
jgi:hypothetical protein